ncbi:MAG: DUF1670 domain-containing protein [Acidimicrobiia bacterium]|nr:DUF1670 domain-containing protein [Acidimicrobiia bacterium]
MTSFDDRARTAVGLVAAFALAESGNPQTAQALARQSLAEERDPAELLGAVATLAASLARRLADETGEPPLAQLRRLRPGPRGDPPREAAVEQPDGSHPPPGPEPVTDLPELVRALLVDDHGIDPTLADRVVADVCDVVDRCHGRTEPLLPGQLLYLAPARDDGDGSGPRTLLVTLTLLAKEDAAASRAGLPAARRREIRVRRIAREAYQQGALLSQADLGLLLGSSRSAVGISASSLRRQGEFLPLRGYVEDAARFPVKRAAVVARCLDGRSPAEVADDVFLPERTVRRYVAEFQRVRVLSRLCEPDDLPHQAGMPAAVVQEYLVLADELEQREGERRSPGGERSAAEDPIESRR